MDSTARENAALVRRFLTDVVVGGDTDAVASVLTEDAVHDNLVFGARPARDAVTALGWRALAAADVDLEIRGMVASEDAVAVRASVSGTHRESLMDLAPTGRTFEIAYGWFCRIEGGRIAAIRSLPDGLGLVEQLGAIPEQPPNSSLPERSGDRYQ